MTVTDILTPCGSSRERGDALLVTALALVVMSIAIIEYVEWQQSSLRESQAERTAEGIVTIQEALYSYRLDPANSLSWPSAIADLNPYIPNFTGGGRNGVGQSYSLHPVTPVTPTSGIFIETDMLTADGAADVARLFPLNGSVPAGTTRVRVGVPVPGHENPRDTVLAVDGNKQMTGSLDMDGNSIVNLAGIVIDGETIDVDTVEMLTDMADLDCTGDERVMLVAGTPDCVAPSSLNTCSDTPPQQSDVHTRWTCTKVYDATGCRWNCISSCGLHYSTRSFWYNRSCADDPNCTPGSGCNVRAGEQMHKWAVCKRGYAKHSTDSGTCYPAWQYHRIECESDPPGISYAWQRTYQCHPHRFMP